MLGSRVQCPNPECGNDLDRGSGTLRYVDPQTGKEISQSAEGSWGKGCLVAVGVLIIGIIISLSAGSNQSGVQGVLIAFAVLFWVGFLGTAFALEATRRAALKSADRMEDYQCPRCGRRWTLKNGKA